MLHRKTQHVMWMRRGHSLPAYCVSH